MRRSVRLADALRLQLEAVRDDAGLRAVVIADDDGFEVAAVGDATQCAELAAVAPIVARGHIGDDARERLAREDVVVRAIPASVRLYVCAAGGTGSRGDALQRAGEGTKRILGL
ncbi:MAG: hypothetical protein IT379_17455 [Deltaproteobacteria bacterium]|nr:hypothetical protein [Deltaproteobacteria bacterium]